MKLTKQLSLFDFTIIMVSLAIGMGIFRTPSNVANAVSSPAIFYAAWIVGGFIGIMRRPYLCRNWQPHAGYGRVL
jgi:APA family basic amino acid/polyamine antiporter